MISPSFAVFLSNILGFLNPLGEVAPEKVDLRVVHRFVVGKPACGDRKWRDLAEQFLVLALRTLAG